MKLLAHLTEQNHTRMEQTLEEHCKKTAEYASQSLASAGLYYTGYLAGLLHDMGKATQKYNAYLEAAFRGEGVVRGSVNHTFTGVIWLFESYHKETSSKWERLACEVIGYAIGSHHGMFDCLDMDGKNGFLHRLKKDRKELCYEEAVSNYFDFVADKKMIEKNFSRALQEVRQVFEKCQGTYRKKPEVMYQMSMLIRIVLSAVIYGDRRNTAEFMNQDKRKEQKEADWTATKEYFEQKIQQFDSSSELNQIRGEISLQCLDAAGRLPGIYRLSLPTGAGKTLDSLRYSLSHAEQYKKKRILFIIPLLSVLEQNAKTICDYLPDSEIVLEHHSNVVREAAQAEEMDCYELSTVSWNENPVIISTLVQLLNVLFLGQTSAISRMQALCDSIIVIDEVQSLPKKVMAMFNMALNFLQQFCNATIVLSSATQPCFEELDWPLCLAEKPDLVFLNDMQRQIFERAVIIDKTTKHGVGLGECASFCGELMEKHAALLVICNTKREASELFKRLDKENAGKVQPWTLFHLSASMCPKHRMNVMQELKEKLALLQMKLRNGEKPEKLICVSTQLAEAGIDFSFEAVIRFMAGIDNLAQATGRCNRSNEYGHAGTVYLIKIKEGDENLRMLPDIRKAKDATNQVIQQKRGGSLIDEAVTQEFYRALFEETKAEMKYPAKIQGEQCYLDSLLANVNQNADKGNVSEHRKFIFHQPFDTIGKTFRVFEENTTDIVVPYQDGKTWIEKLATLEKKEASPAKLKALTEKMKLYSISIFQWQKDVLNQAGYLRAFFGGRILVLDEKAYDDQYCGLLYEREQPVGNYIL